MLLLTTHRLLSGFKVQLENIEGCFSCGNYLSHSDETWRILVRQSWLMGFLKRSLAVCNGHNRMSSIVNAVYTTTAEGSKLFFSRHKFFFGSRTFRTFSSLRFLVKKMSKKFYFKKMSKKFYFQKKICA